MVKETKTYFEVLKWASSFLESKGKETAIGEYLILKRLGWDKTTWLLNLREVAPPSLVAQLTLDLEKVAEDYPPQYVIGTCDFYGNEFQVTEDTLIPRPETEELVALCLAQHSEEKLKVLDIGTGTGAIAITLKRERPTWQVTATDISLEALTVAKRNAAALEAEIEFRHGDLTAPVIHEKYDLILSNPPYISQEEWQVMDASVRKYEPKQALFAENAGYDIYQRLGKELPLLLNPSGSVYLEIGYQQGAQVKKLMSEAFPNYPVQLYHDLNQLPRMITVN